MEITSTYKLIYSTLKNGNPGSKIIGYELVSEEKCYSPEELDKHGNVKPLTEAEIRAEADKQCMMLFGMDSDDYVKRIMKAFKEEKVEKRSKT